MDVVQDIAAPGELDAGGASEFSDAHGDDIERGPLTLPEIEEPIELGTGVGSRGDFHDRGA